MSLSSIDLKIRELLKDPVRRHEFFKAITQDDIAEQIRALRKKRALTQTALAEQSDMKQSAVSRIEQAEYSRWTLTTLMRVAKALDARWRMILQPCEQAVAEFEDLERAISQPIPTPPPPPERNIDRDAFGDEVKIRSADDQIKTRKGGNMVLT